MAGGGSSSSSGDSSVILTGGQQGKPTGFIDAISKIERMSGMETKGAEIPAVMFTTKERIEFWEVGFISTLNSALFSFILTPVAIGVLERLIPVFGSTEPSVVDQILVFMLAISFSVGYAIFLGRLGTYFRGPYTRAMIKNFFGGVAASAFLKIVIALALFHYLAFVVLDRQRVGMFLLNFESTVGTDRLAEWFVWIMSFKKVFLISAWFITATTCMYVFVPAISILRKILKERQIIKHGGTVI
ncbi:MAG: hypothetical protein CSYNP_02835 [Syntrophus sp. SKADARSKE-3]|nr:hypothetical protein [Syntrophus sp. SKADARSKE-3]